MRLKGRCVSRANGLGPLSLERRYSTESAFARNPCGGMLTFSMRNESGEAMPPKSDDPGIINHTPRGETEIVEGLLASGCPVLHELRPISRKWARYPP